MTSPYLNRPTRTEAEALHDQAEAGHTPGKWEAKLSDGRETLCVVADDAWICGEIMNSIPEAEAWANARLIAAAPDLLSALHSARHALANAITAASPGLVLEPNEHPVIKGINAAIKRAEGRS